MTPVIYDPKQLAPNTWLFEGCCCAWHTHTSDFCRAFAVAYTRCCSIPTYKLDDHELLVKMCSNVNSNCPESLRGVWWMKDNPAAETLITLHDAEWQADRRRFNKKGKSFWTRDPTCFGVTLQAIADCRNWSISGEVVDFKWIRLDDSCHNLLYVVDDHDDVRFPDGGATSVKAGDIIRYKLTKGSQLSTAVIQYHFKRVARIHTDGRVITTDAYAELLSHVHADQWPEYSPKTSLRKFDPLNSMQICRT